MSWMNLFLPPPAPFLMWAGGKRQVLPHILPIIDKLNWSGRYIEPFLGGGAVFFELARRDQLGNRQPRLHGVRLADINPKLVEVYVGVKDHLEAVVGYLRAYDKAHKKALAEGRVKDYYYNVRANVPDNLPERAARFIYLNRTCFNGLYRENNRGDFNVSFGKKFHLKILNETLLQACSTALHGVEILAQDFEATVEDARPGDLVYFDPPYVPESRTANFTAYTKDGFGMEDQERLARTFARLADRGVHVILSNSNTPVVHNLYKDFPIMTIQARRAINRDASKRGLEEREVLVVGRGVGR